DPEQEHFADGLTEDVITSLAKLHWLPVLARKSTAVYKGRSVTIKQVRAELGVRYILEGSVRKSADNVRITIQLVDAETGEHLWAERYDRESRQLFAVQDEVARLVPAAIAPVLREVEQRRTGIDPTRQPDGHARWRQAAAERRQITVLSCELVDAARQSSVDLERLRDVIAAY